MDITLNVLVDYEVFFIVDTCNVGHTTGKIENMHFWSLQMLS